MKRRDQVHPIYLHVVGDPDGNVAEVWVRSRGGMRMIVARFEGGRNPKERADMWARGQTCTHASGLTT